MYLVCRLLLSSSTSLLFPLSLHDALPISFCRALLCRRPRWQLGCPRCPSRRHLPHNLPQSEARRLAHHRHHPRDSILLQNRRHLRRPRKLDRKSTRLNSSHRCISYAVFCFLPLPLFSSLFPYTTLFRSLFAAPCFAADLAGNWAVRDALPDGTYRTTYLNLKQDGSRITGTIRVTQFFYRIVDTSGGPEN